MVGTQTLLMTSRVSMCFMDTCMYLPDKRRSLPTHSHRRPLPTTHWVNSNSEAATRVVQVSGFTDTPSKKCKNPTLFVLVLWVCD
jgi:hypothetical protein